MVLTNLEIASCQSLSGTGALLLAGLALKKVCPGVKTALITDPTWSNHELLFTSLGFEVQKLPYYKNGAFDFDNYMTALKAAPPGSIVVLQYVIFRANLPYCSRIHELYFHTRTQRDYLWGLDSRTCLGPILSFFSAPLSNC